MILYKQALHDQISVVDHGEDLGLQIKGESEIVPLSEFPKRFRDYVKTLAFNFNYQLSKINIAAIADVNVVEDFSGTKFFGGYTHFRVNGTEFPDIALNISMNTEAPPFQAINMFERLSSMIAAQAEKNYQPPLRVVS